MSGALHIVIGSLLAASAWLLPRHVAKTRSVSTAAVFLDLLPVALAGGLIIGATGRPIFTGVVLLSLGAGFALADRTKREVLREPVVFSEMSELRHVFTHPQLYLPFAGPTLVIGGAVAAIGLSIALLSFEPELWKPNPLLVFFCGGLLAAGIWLISREPILSAAAELLKEFRATGEPFRDAATLGPFAMVLTYGVIARAERATRRARHVPRPAPAPALRRAQAPVPLIVVQCESFFDARRLSPTVPQALLSGFDACCGNGGTFGRLEVPGWGANTMRAEFAVLTGIPESELGYDRFNPYHAFARVPIASLVWHLRAQGYRTVCLHPFDRSFFRRDLTLPALGFETFLGIETLGGSRRPPYYSDPELAEHVLKVLDIEGPRVFIFAITMGNHGPWRAAGPPINPKLRRNFDVAGLPQGGELLRYLDGLGRSDEMLQILLTGLQRRHGEGVLAFYGDHLPSLPHAFRHFGFDEIGSDYVVWRGSTTVARPLDLPAHRLPRVIIDALRAKEAIDIQGASALVAAR
ncbi:MAG: LTA synthase family protein [Alphaproteobacteria bacterium]|nr:LTA synthase family protein [Alphaproteobacteria bacterium]